MEVDGCLCNGCRTRSATMDGDGTVDWLSLEMVLVALWNDLEQHRILQSHDHGYNHFDWATSVALNDDTVLLLMFRVEDFG